MLPGKKYTPPDFLRMARRRLWIILIPTVLGAYAALMVSSRLQDVYQSEMLIQVVPQSVPDSYVRSTVTMKTEDRLNALSQQVMSRTELERLINQMNLYQADRLRMPMQDVTERMRESITIEAVRSQRENRDTDAFYIRFRYPDREVAARVTERFGALFIEFNSSDRGKLADATNNFLQTQLVEARGRLEVTERKLERFREQNAGRLPSQLDFNLVAMQGVQTQLQALVESVARDRDRKLMLEGMFSDAQAEAAITPAVPTSPSGQLPLGATAAQKLQAAKENLARLQLRLRPQHPDITRQVREIGELETAAAAEKRAADAQSVKALPTALTPEAMNRRDRVQEMRAQIESLDRQITFREAEEQRLRDSVAQYQRRIEQVPGVESEMVALTRDYETQQMAYKDLLAKSEQSQVAAALEKRQIGEQFRVLDPARPPVRPIGLPRLQVNAIGAAVGLFLGLALAGLLEFLDTTYHTAQDVMDVLQLPVVALVPLVHTADDKSRLLLRRRLTTVAAALAVLVGAYGAWTMELWKHVR